MHQSLKAETRIEYLERNLREVRREAHLLENRCSGNRYYEYSRELRDQAHKIRKELHELRPFEIVEDDKCFIVAHKGMFALNDAGEFLTFEDKSSASAWVNDNQPDA
jgi:hypothetical protein